LVEPLDIIVVDFHILGPLSKFWERISPHFQEEGREKKREKKPPW
jgi:hypothetical protein